VHNVSRRLANGRVYQYIFMILACWLLKTSFAARRGSGFSAFCDDEPYSRVRVARITKQKYMYWNPMREKRFLYQEFVRHNHGTRIRAWIMGQAKEELGIANAAVAEVGRLGSLWGCNSAAT